MLTRYVLCTVVNVSEQRTIALTSVAGLQHFSCKSYPSFSVPLRDAHLLNPPNFPFKYHEQKGSHSLISTCVGMLNLLVTVELFGMTLL